MQQLTGAKGNSQSGGPYKLRPAFKLPSAPAGKPPQPKGFLALQPKVMRQRMMQQQQQQQQQQQDQLRRLSTDSSSSLSREPTGPPPIRRVELGSNPEFWTSHDTAVFLSKTGDCEHLAGFMLEDDIDGRAFMLLNFATVLEHWSLSLQTAIQLCRHVESVRLAHWTQFKATQQQQQQCN